MLSISVFGTKSGRDWKHIKVYAIQHENLLKENGPNFLEKSHANGYSHGFRCHYFIKKKSYLIYFSHWNNVSGSGVRPLWFIYTVRRRKLFGVKEKHKSWRTESGTRIHDWKKKNASWENFQCDVCESMCVCVCIGRRLLLPSSMSSATNVEQQAQQRFSLPSIFSRLTSIVRCWLIPSVCVFGVPVH